MELIAWLFLLVVSAWVYSDAKERGSNSPAMWAIGTFLFLIIVLPIWLIKRKPKVQRMVQVQAPPPIPSPAQAKLCPHCGKYYEGTPIFCPNCGTRIQMA